MRVHLSKYLMFLSTKEAFDFHIFHILETVIRHSHYKKHITPLVSKLNAPAILTPCMELEKKAQANEYLFRCTLFKKKKNNPLRISTKG